MLDPHAERILGEQGGRGARHAAFHEVAFEHIADARGDRAVAPKDEGHQAQRPARMVGLRREGAGEVFVVRTDMPRFPTSA